MKIYDISQEVFSSAVFPGDPAPHKEVLLDMARGAACNLSAFFMCAHNGTHLDAPRHFILDGAAVDEIPLERTVGWAFVVTCGGEISASRARDILALAAQAKPEAARRILIKGKAVVTLEAAKVFAQAGVFLIGNESQTVGPENAPMAVHKTLLGAGAVLLEGIRLDLVADGVYWLHAAPLLLAGGDGAPCRATLTAGLKEI